MAAFVCAALFVFLYLTPSGGHKSASQYLRLQSFAPRKGWRAKTDIEGIKRSNRDEDDYETILTDLFLLPTHL